MSERFKPDFIGVGMAKCGSTWVTQILQEHPDIFIPEKKELNFFIYAILTFSTLISGIKLR